MKTYIKPTSKVIELSGEQILAGSDPSLCNELGNTGVWHAKGRGGDDWDEDEDF